MSTDSAEATALFRYRVIAGATSPRLSPAERGRLVRELARQIHEHPDGSRREYSRGTLDRWIRAYREQGLDGLKPERRSDLGEVRRHPELLNEACALLAELPTPPAQPLSTDVDYVGLVVAEHDRQVLGHIASAICPVAPRRRNHEPGTLGQPLRLHAHAIQQDDPGWPALRSRQPPGSHRAYALLH